VAGLVGFDLVERQLDLPAVGIDRGELDRGCELVVEQCGDQTDLDHSLGWQVPFQG